LEEEKRQKIIKEAEDKPLPKKLVEDIEELTKKLAKILKRL